MEVLCNEEWHDVHDFRSFSEKNDGGRLYNYYIALAELAASLCYNRNYRAISSFEEVYPFEVAFKIIGDNTLLDVFKCKMVTVLLNLHLDREPLEALVVPNLTRVWDEVLIQTSARIPASK